MKRFENRVAVVTGAGRGMGKACGMAFAREGAVTIFVDIDQQSAALAAEMAVREGGKALGCPCDVSSAGDIKRIIDIAMSKYGTIDILVNNAGVLRTTRPMEEIPEKDWDLI